MSYRYAAAINKPGFNPLGAQTSSTVYDLYTWGYNANGELGLGNRTSYSSPKQVGGTGTWLQLAGGYTVSLGVKSDGTLWSWGANDLGQLGLGTTTYYSSPKQVGALTNWLTVSEIGRAHV